MSDYKTVRVRGRGGLAVKRSRFIGQVCPVKTQQEAEAFIAGIRREHRDAAHNVWAYILREEKFRRYSDDGEPQGTAGLPVLGVLEKGGVRDVCAVVTRYFGGVLLGAGGLVRAYSRAASLALTAGGIVTLSRFNRLRLRMDYSFYGRFSALLNEYGGRVDKSWFDDGVTAFFRVPAGNLGAFRARLLELSDGRFSPEMLGEDFAEK